MCSEGPIKPNENAIKKKLITTYSLLGTFFKIIGRKTLLIMYGIV
jgi:hypothetical protein